MTPIEKAVLAIEAELGRQTGTIEMPYVDELDGDFLIIDGRIQMSPIVRAVLEAIREPSEAMLERAAHYENKDRPKQWVTAMWMDMIDAALGEGPGA